MAVKWRSVAIQTGALLAWFGYTWQIIFLLVRGKTFDFALATFLFLVLLGMICRVRFCYIISGIFGRILAYGILSFSNNPFALMDVYIAHESLHVFFVECLAACFAFLIINYFLAEQAKLRKIKGAETLSGFP